MIKNTIAITLAYFLLCSPVVALEQSKLDYLSKLMVSACTLGESIGVIASGNGKISIKKLGVEGEGSFSRSRIPAIMDSIMDDKIRAEQANETRECMRYYLDRIFDQVLGVNTSITTNVASVDTPQFENILITFESFYGNYKYNALALLEIELYDTNGEVIEILDAKASSCTNQSDVCGNSEIKNTLDGDTTWGRNVPDLFWHPVNSTKKNDANTWIKLRFKKSAVGSVKFYYWNSGCMRECGQPDITRYQANAKIASVVFDGKKAYEQQIVLPNTSQARAYFKF